ncbi:hypothetical protein AGA_1473 [Acetobacter ghanensis]|nr:hypothetical protein AGA_1473 [Acetobacter ghanensis]
MLLDECAAAHVRILTDVRVYGVEKCDVFRVQTSMGDLTARAVVLATGGLSIPKLGASRFTYEVARQFGLAIVPPEPALVPLTFSGESEEWVRSLAGLSLPVRVTCGKTSFEEALLFTHRGMSGPALLQISSYWSAGQPLFVDFLPGQDIAALLAKLKKEGCKAKGAGALARWLPQRLAHALVELGAPERTLAEWADRDIRLMAERVHRMELRPQGTEGFAKAEVTRGGVDTRGLSSQTMEARTVPGLYVVGEAVDVTGWLGGYNFHWAWASGHAAGEALGAA